jgi:hypothetical protein
VSVDVLGPRLRRLVEAADDELHSHERLRGNGLVCSLGYCVSACVTSADCAKGERCIITMLDGADGGSGTSCQAPETVHCQYNSQCDSPLLCAPPALAPRGEAALRSDYEGQPLAPQYAGA